MHSVYNYVMHVHAAIGLRYRAMQYTNCTALYTVSQKKTFPTFLAITRESIDGFL